MFSAISVCLASPFINVPRELGNAQRLEYRLSQREIARGFAVTLSSEKSVRKVTLGHLKMHALFRRQNSEANGQST